MLNSIEEALSKTDELVIDDCAALCRVFQYNSEVIKSNSGEIIKYNFEELKKFNDNLKSKISSKEGFYFQDKKHHFYNPGAVSEIIDFMVLKNEKMLFDRIIMNANPGKYESTACLNYEKEEIIFKFKPEPKETNKNRLFLMNFKK